MLNTVEVSIYTSMVISMRGNGRMIRRMGRVVIHTSQLGRNTMDSG